MNTVNKNIIVQSPMISVIIPVYGVEEYIEKCIHSLLNQSFTDFEAIIVDDGSLDRKHPVNAS